VSALALDAPVAVLGPVLALVSMALGLSSVSVSGASVVVLVPLSGPALALPLVSV